MPRAKKTNPKRSASSAKQSLPRRLKQSNYKSFKLTKRIKHPVKIASSIKLMRAALEMIWSNKRLFVGIVLVYGLLAFVLVRGLSGAGNVQELKDQIDEIFGDTVGGLEVSLSLFSVLLGSAFTSSGEAGSVYQIFLTLIVSLAIIWTIRQLHADTKTKLRVKDGFYQGIYPLVPFVLVMAVIFLQLLPMLVGSWIYGTVISAGIAVTAAEKFLWLLIFILLSVLSLYMVTSSAFALYIVTLPEMTPLKALRSARQLVAHRRTRVALKVIFLPIFMLMIAAVIMLPIIILAAWAAEWIFLILSMTAIVLVHTYMYHLYRELLK